jgi:hypothetical protein
MRSAVPLFLLLPLLTLAHAAPARPTAPAAPAADSREGKVAGPPPAFVYLLARVKLVGTDLTESVFFRHSALSTLEECEAERLAGLTTGWRYLNRYYLKTFKGFTYEVDYRCVGSDRQELGFWRPGMPSDQFYLVETHNSELQVTPFSNFFTCRDSLRKLSAKEDISTFCTLSSQALLAKKPG